jgi:hypothetical protein
MTNLTFKHFFVWKRQAECSIDALRDAILRALPTNALPAEDRRRSLRPAGSERLWFAEVDVPKVVKQATASTLSPAPCEPVTDQCDGTPGCYRVDLCPADSSSPCKSPCPPLRLEQKALPATVKRKDGLDAMTVLKENAVLDGCQPVPISGVPKQLEAQSILGGQNAEIKEAKSASTSSLMMESRDWQVAHTVSKSFLRHQSILPSLSTHSLTSPASCLPSSIPPSVTPNFHSPPFPTPHTHPFLPPLFHPCFSLSTLRPLRPPALLPHRPQCLPSSLQHLFTHSLDLRPLPPSTACCRNPSPSRWALLQLATATRLCHRKGG